MTIARNSNIDWTAEHVEFLTQKWKSGITAKQISADFLAAGLVVSRSAVLGKAKRLKLISNHPHGGARQPMSPRPKTHHPRAVRPKLVPFVKRPVVPAQEVEVYTPPSLLMDRPLTSLVDLGPQQCKFPQGDPRQPDFGFCAAPTDKGRAYCDLHHGRAYTPRMAT